MTAIEDVGMMDQPHDEPTTTPFQALRVAYGMLLGVKDFNTLVGYGRGKHMLHNAWLHGAGVVWGYKVTAAGGKLKVGPGLALDSAGREVHLDAEWCLDVDAWFEDWRDRCAQRGESYDDEVCVWLVASYRTCLAGPVPALADPCDLGRKNTDYSRWVETAHLELRKDAPGCRPVAFHRVRAMIGLEPADPSDDEYRRALEEDAGASPDERAAHVLRAFRTLAALDVRDLAPRAEAGEVGCGLFPVPEDDGAVVLAKVCLRPPSSSDSGKTTQVDIDVTCRPSLLPTAVIQELTCGLVGAAGEAWSADAGGPRVDPSSRLWESDNCVAFDVDRELRAASLVKDQSIVVTRLSRRGWTREAIRRISYSRDTRTVHVELERAAGHDAVRLIARGTGPTPVMGADDIPLAGVLGGPPGSEDDGHDAVLNFVRRATT